MSDTRQRKELKKCVEVEKQVTESQATLMKESAETEESIRARLQEHLCGFILIGFVAETGTPVITQFHDTPMTFLALNELLNRFYNNWKNDEDTEESTGDDDDDDGDAWKEKT